MNSILSRISGAIHGKQPFVIFAKPSENFVTAVFESELEKDQEEEERFIFHPFDNGKSVSIAYYHSEILSAALPIKRDRKFLQDQFTYVNGSEFKDLVEKAKAVILSGKMDKVVLSRKESLSIKIDLSGTLENLLCVYPTAFRYCFYHPDAGIWMGATPEKLLSVHDGKYATMSLAGTRKFTVNSDAAWGDKEQIEQQFVTDYIKDALLPIVATVETSAPKSHHAGSISHIKTNIYGEMGNAAIESVLNALHPTPAVCGLPKKAAIAFITGNEGYNREYYSGYLGEVKNGTAPTADLFVNLRCMKITEEGADIFVGCGITADSDAEAEFLETVNKSMTMKSIII